MHNKIMPMLKPDIEELKKMSVTELKALADNYTEEYLRLIKVVPVSGEASECRKLIATIHNLINQKGDKMEPPTGF